MRKLIVPLLAIAFFLNNSQTRAAEPTPLTLTEISRLESLCRVWGVVKFFHPWIVAPPDGKPIDWDAALIETIPLVENATTAEEFRAAVNHLLSALHDPATRAMIPGAEQDDSKQPAVEPGLPETKLGESGGKKVLVITATDWRRLGGDQRKSFGGLFWNAFAKAADADAIILDLRRQDKPPPDFDRDRDAFIIGNGLRADVSALIKTDLTLAAARSRFHSGYASETGGTSGGYFSGFTIGEHTALRAFPGPGVGKRLVILTNSGTRGVTSILAALQASVQTVVLHDSPDLSNFADGETYSMRLVDGVIAAVRTADLVNADGTVGFVPDIVVEAAKDRDRDAQFDAALSIARGEANPPARLSIRLATGQVRPDENKYAEMTSPSREYRLLGLFRVWNVMHYFFPYKHLMDPSWDSVLTEFIPRFAEADSPPKFGFAIREMLSHLQDSHVNAGGPPLNAALAQLGIASPLILLQPVRDEVVVVAADDSVKDRVHIGDVVLAIDGQSVPERSARIAKYVAASTPQALHRRLSGDLLRGRPGAPAVLKLRSVDGTVREESIPRPFNAESAPAIRTLVESRQRKTPVFGVLPEGHGYFDLIRLTVTEVNAAFDAVKETSALIMDMRGYPRGTAWSICARLTDKPMTMAIFRRPYWTSPDPHKSVDFTFSQPIEPSPLWKYTGRIVVLVNEDAISQSEHSCLGFEEAAKGRITFIGTPTTGANGDVTSTSMPGGIRVTFSGHDVRHADGRQLQRIGIQPDIRVEPTIAGIVVGKDEVLDAAITFLNESKAK